MRDDEARRLILARRARFVAAALAGVCSSQGCATKPGVCLSQRMVEIDAGGEPEPEPDEPGEAADAGAEPQVCLEPVPQVCLEPAPQVCLEAPEPQACLKVAPGPSTSQADAGKPRRAPPPRICLSEY